MGIRSNQPVKLDFEYEPHRYQQMLHRMCSLSHRNPIKIVVLNAGRRSGKTLGVMHQCLFWIFNYSQKKRVIWWLMPTETQSEKIYLEMSAALRGTGLVTKEYKSRGRIEIHFLNKSVIYFMSARSDDSLRGAGVDCMVIDEAAYVPEKIFNDIALPMLSTSENPRLIICSTPRGKSNWFYKWYQRGQDKENKDTISFSFTYKENPRINESFIQSIKSSMPDKVFRQEYLAEWLDAGQVFSNLSQCVKRDIEKEPIEKIKYYGGIDYALGGAGGDYNCITIINEKGEVVFIDRFRNMGLKGVKARFIKTLQKWKCKKIYMEKAGMNFLYQDLRDNYHIENLEEYQMDPTNKEKLVHNLIGAFEEEAIKIPDSSDLLSELDSFVPKVTASGRVVYGAYGSMKDDMVMSLGIAWQCYIKHKNSGKIIFDVA